MRLWRGGYYGHHGGRFVSRRGFRRRFITQEERKAQRLAWLEDYLKELQAEAKGVEERIAEIKKEGNE